MLKKYISIDKKCDSYTNVTPVRSYNIRKFPVLLKVDYTRLNLAGAPDMC